MTRENKHNSVDPGYPSNELLMNYLSGKLSKDERRILEEFLTDDDFGSDAIEGLQQVIDNSETKRIEKKLKKSIHYTLFKKAKKNKAPLTYPLWLISLIAFVLLVILAGYFILSSLKQ